MQLRSGSVRCRCRRCVVGVLLIKSVFVRSYCIKVIVPSVSFIALGPMKAAQNLIYSGLLIIAQMHTQ